MGHHFFKDSIAMNNMLQAFVLVFLVAGTFGLPSAQKYSHKIVGVHGANNISQTDALVLVTDITGTRTLMPTTTDGRCQNNKCIQRVNSDMKCATSIWKAFMDADCQSCICKSSTCETPTPKTTTTTPPTTTTTTTPPTTTTTTTPPTTTPDPCMNATLNCTYHIQQAKLTCKNVSPFLEPYCVTEILCQRKMERCIWCQERGNCSSTKCITGIAVGEIKCANHPNKLDCIFYHLSSIGIPRCIDCTGTVDTTITAIPITPGPGKRSKREVNQRNMLNTSDTDDDMDNINGVGEESDASETDNILLYEEDEEDLERTTETMDYGN